MANRVANSSDVSAYASATKGLMQVGDVILDTGAVDDGSFSNIIYYTDFGTRFSTMRNNAVIWVDVTTLGILYQFWIGNGGSPIGKGHNIIRPTLNGPIRVITDTNTNSGQTCVFSDFDSFEIDGEFLNKDGYEGMTHGLGRSIFLTGTFGFEVRYGTARMGNNQIHIIVEDGGDVICRGVEVMGGFAGITVNQVEVAPKINRMIMERCYLHDAVGEGFYLNKTTGVRPQIEEILVSDCLIVRRGTENVQIQNMIAGAVRGQIKNLISAQSAITWKNTFLADQDGNAQFVFDEGGTEVINTIFDGGNYGIKIFSTGGGSPDGVARVVFRNNLMQNFNHRGIYYHSTVTEDIPIDIRKLWIRNKGNKQTEAGYPSTTQLVDDDGDPSYRRYIDIKHDGSFSVFGTSGSETGSHKIGIEQTTIEAPEFVNTGFDPDEQISAWADEYSSHSPNNGINTTWVEGEIMVDARDTANYRFYKVNTAHTSNGTPPPSNSNVDLLTWDESGVRSDKPGHNSGDIQSYIPPDDWRLVADNFYNRKGLGLLSNLRNTDHTQVQWYRAPNNNPSLPERIPIPGAHRRTYTPREVDRGWYIAMGVKAKNSTGYKTEKFSLWKPIS